MTAARRIAWGDVLLAGLVLGSFALSARLSALGAGWPTAPAPGLRRAPEAAPLPATGLAPSIEELLEPVDLVAHLGEGRHVRLRPGTRAYQDVWAAVRSAFGRHAPLEPVGEASPAMRKELESRRDGPGVEVLLPLPRPLEEWVSLWRGAAESRPWPVTQRALFSLQAPPAALYWVDGEQVLGRAPLSVGADSLREALRGVAAVPPPGDAELPPTVGSLRVDRGIYVPRGVALSPRRIRAEPPELPAYARAFFDDPSGLRQVAERDGAVILTEGRRGLRLYPSGGLEYAAGGERRSDVEPLSAELELARAYVRAHGGWPAGAHLQGRAIVDGRRELEFSYRIEGWPVVGPRPPLRLQLSGDRVLGYQRFVWSTVEVGPPRPLIDAAAALARLGERWLGAFPSGAERRVVGMSLGFALPDPVRAAAGGDAAAVRPVWAIQVKGGQRALVDAFTGELVR